MTMVEEILVGLSQTQKTISPKYLYDKKGAELFELICEQPEYYPTKVEFELLHGYAEEISQLIGSGANIVDLGCGNGEKAKILLRKLISPISYIPVEISSEVLEKTAVQIKKEFPELGIHPFCGDFTQEIEVPVGKNIFFFPGSTIGNFDPRDAIKFLQSIRSIMGNDSGLLIGVDTKKDLNLLQQAYNDQQGVTAQFNLNLLNRINRELGASFSPETFVHEAFFNERMSRVEMHLKSKITQSVRVHQTLFRFQKGETIHTESSYKYAQDEFCGLAAKAELYIKKIWTDRSEMFALYYFGPDT